MAKFVMAGRVPAIHVCCWAPDHQFVVAGLKREARLRAYVPAIHVFCGARKQDVDARDRPGHDGVFSVRKQDVDGRDTPGHDETAQFVNAFLSLNDVTEG
jgi:hypothetical protein